MLIIDRKTDTVVSSAKFAKTINVSAWVLDLWAKETLPLTERRAYGKKVSETRAVEDLALRIPEIRDYCEHHKEVVRATRMRAINKAIEVRTGSKTQRREQLAELAERMQRVEAKLDELLTEWRGTRPSVYSGNGLRQQ